MPATATRISVDIGGTFTDLVQHTASGVTLFKAPTIPDDPVRSVFDALERAAAAEGLTVRSILARTDVFTHATTRGLNAVVTGTTARTAFLTTAGHPDVLLLREGGRSDPFDFTVPYPEPYVPRSLTYEIPERITASGAILRPLDEAAVDAVCERLAGAAVEAVAVCLLWSVANAAHELKVGERLRARLPDVPFTLSHELNPTLREYRRAMSASIDASLKPVMTSYLGELTSRLRTAGFAGRLLMVTSIGGVLGVDDVARAPIHALKSGPAVAPIAGRAYAQADAGSDVAIVTDAGGTTYDVTLVSKGHVPWTRETWIGPTHASHITGFPSIDVRSVGAGGGSIASVDPGGLLHVGPESAGSIPGPACYGRGGTRPTVTDASVVLGYLDPLSFAAGSMTLDVEAAAAAIRRDVAQPLGLDLVPAAAAVMRLTTEQMVRSIEEITLQQGIDPAEAVLVGGGGAAGLNAVAVARRLGCPRVVMPVVGAALASAGALMSDQTSVYTRTVTTSSCSFDADKVNAALAALEEQCRAFAERIGVEPGATSVELFVEAHYPQQIWDLEVPLAGGSFQSEQDVALLVADFHAVHERVLGIADRASEVEIVSCGARVRCSLGEPLSVLTPAGEEAAPPESERTVHFADVGAVSVPVRTPRSIADDERLEGPAIVESAYTTLVLPPGAVCERGRSGSLVIAPLGSAESVGTATSATELEVR